MEQSMESVIEDLGRLLEEVEFNKLVQAWLDVAGAAAVSSSPVGGLEFERYDPLSTTSP